MFTILYPESFLFSVLLLALSVSHCVTLGMLHKLSVSQFSLCKTGIVNTYLIRLWGDWRKGYRERTWHVMSGGNNWLISLLMTDAHMHVGSGLCLGTRYRDQPVDPPDLIPICKTRAYLKDMGCKNKCFYQ